MTIYHNTCQRPKTHSGVAEKGLGMENVKETGASAPSKLDASGQNPKLEPGSRNRGAVMTALHFVAATHAWKKQASILKKRASFPLLRQILKNHHATGRVVLPVEDIADVYLAKTVIGHRIILAVSVVGVAWALHLLVKGMAVAIRFDTPWNTWLICSLPMLLFTGVNAAMSWRVQKQFGYEIARREANRSQLGDSHG